MSPEQIKESKYNEKSDIWSAGCVLYEMAAQRPPFEAANQLSLAAKIKIGKFDKLPSKYSEELNRVAAWMLRVSPEERPTVDDLLNVPQISLRLREKRLRENQGLLQKKQDEVAKKESEAISKEKTMAQLKKTLEEKKKTIEALEKRLEDLKKKDQQQKSINATMIADKENNDIRNLGHGVSITLTMDHTLDGKKFDRIFSGTKKKDRTIEPVFTRIGVSAKKKLNEELWSKKL